MLFHHRKRNVTEAVTEHIPRHHQSRQDPFQSRASSSLYYILTFCMGTVNIQLESNKCFLNFMEYLSLKIGLGKLIHTLKRHIIIFHSGVTLPAILIYSTSTD